MDQTNLDRDIQQLVPLLADLYSIDAVYRQPHDIAFSLTPRYERARSLKAIKDRLRIGGYRY